MVIQMKKNVFLTSVLSEIILGGCLFKSFAKILLLSVIFSGTATADIYACKNDCKNDYERVIEDCEYAAEEEHDEYKEEVADRLRNHSGKAQGLNDWTKSNLDDSRRLNRIVQSEKRCKDRSGNEYKRCTSSCGY